MSHPLGSVTFRPGPNKVVVDKSIRADQPTQEFVSSKQWKDQGWSKEYSGINVRKTPQPTPAPQI